jgi:hypothetical protein
MRRKARRRVGMEWKKKKKKKKKKPSPAEARRSKRKGSSEEERGQTHSSLPRSSTLKQPHS